MISQSTRIQRHHELSAYLQHCSTDQLHQLLATGKPVYAGIGGTGLVISVLDTPLFVKKIFLGRRELQAEHLGSTANYYQLPSYYQYGVGSYGFGAWRELAAHQLTTAWAATGKCPAFPLMHHYRQMDLLADNNTHRLPIDVEVHCRYWENSTTLAERISELNQSTQYLAVFLEYVPNTLHDWLQARLLNDKDTSPAAVEWTLRCLTEVNQFMRSQGFLHFDAHFQNILTDGNQLYLIDFGLALSRTFDLSSVEREFFTQHHDYDQACASANLTHTLVTTLCGKDNYRQNCQHIAVDGYPKLFGELAATLQCHAAIALVMDDFFRDLQKKSKQTVFPYKKLDHNL